MRCPTCGVDDDKVVDSRPADNGTSIRRRRECLGCNDRFTTFERVDLPTLSVRKQSGAVAPFSRQKVLDGMSRASNERIPVEVLEQAAVQIEAEIRALGESEVTSEQVGFSVLGRLRELDPVTYVRFASVYKDFQGPEDFEQELSSLSKAQ